MEDLDTLEKKAIESAVKLNWDESIKLNLQILKKDPKNLSAILRLAFAYFQKQDYKKSQIYYKKALKIQPGLAVAKANLEKINVLLSKKIRVKKKGNHSLKLDPNVFIETFGKTKTVKLVNLGQKNIIADLSPGEEVFLKIKKRKVDVRTKNNDYIGSLPDDLSRRLRLFIKAGSQYQVLIKEASINNIVIFIKEIKKGPRVANFISFPEDLSKNLAFLDQENEVDNEEIDQEEEIEKEFDIEKLAETITEDKENLDFQQNIEETEDESS